MRAAATADAPEVPLGFAEPLQCAFAVLQWLLESSGCALPYMHKLYWVLMRHWVLMLQPATQTGHHH